MGIAQHLIYNTALGVGKIEVGGIKGSVATVGALPVGAENGDIYIVEADGHGYSWNGTLWTDIGLFRGPAGPQGIQGEAGPVGTTLHSGLTDQQGGTTGEHYHLTLAQHQNLPATITAAGGALLDDADAAAQRTTLGLGTAAVADLATVAQQSDIGTAPNQLPLNQYLGGMAYQDHNAVQITGGVATVQLRRRAPVTKTANFTVADTEHWLICNGAASITVTLPNASTNIGREIMLRNIAAFTVVSASANVVPLIGGAAGTEILAGAAGKYATLVSDGTNWLITEGN